MTDEIGFPEDVVAAYRRRRAPAGLARRVTALAAERTGRRSSRWLRPVVAAAVLALAIALPVGLLKRSDRGPEGIADSLPSMPAFPSRIGDPGEISVPGLSAIGGMPSLPSRPSFDLETIPDIERRIDDIRGSARHIRLTRNAEEHVHAKS